MTLNGLVLPSGRHRAAPQTCGAPAKAFCTRWPPARFGRPASWRSAVQPPIELAVFDATVIDVRRHVAPYAEVTGLIGFRLNDPVSTLDRWRRQIERIRASS